MYISWVVASRACECISVRLNSCLEELRNVLGDSTPEHIMIEAVIEQNFNFEKSLNSILNTSGNFLSAKSRTYHSLWNPSVMAKTFCKSAVNSPVAVWFSETPKQQRTPTSRTRNRGKFWFVWSICCCHTCIRRSATRAQPCFHEM